MRDVHVDQVYACLKNHSDYERARILKVFENDNEDAPKYVIVKYIDEGSIAKVPVSNFLLFFCLFDFYFEK